MAKLNQPSRLDRAEERLALARIEFETARTKARTAVLNKYDALEPNTKRRQSRVETGGEGKILDPRKRILGANLGRDLERNYPPAKASIHQMRVNVVGSLGKLRVNVEGGDEAAKWFNGEWAPDCDFRADLHWSDWLQNTIAAIEREGDQLTVFDDGVTPEDSGKLLTWEADQIAPISDSLLKASPWAGHTQDNGILRDPYGREVAYIVSGKRGRAIIAIEGDYSIYPRGIARLMCNPWRHNQGRGVAGILAGAAMYQDMYELITSEVQTAKRAAKQYAFIKRENAVEDWDDPGSDPAWLPENAGKGAAAVAGEGANEATNTGAANYERLEGHVGGLIDYGETGDSIEYSPANRPNASIEKFLDAMHGQAASGQGIASAYAKLRADKSYTAFRGDMIMTWVTFYWKQKRLERIACDWTARQAIAWGARHGRLKEPAAGWQGSLSWTWPRMPEVDQLDHEQAVDAGLKNGTTSFGALLGPDWKEKMESFAAELEFARELGLPLGVFDGKANVENIKKQPNGSTSDE